MCSNFQPIKRSSNDWVKDHFGIDLPNEEWRPEAYPTYHAPFVFIEDGQVKCELAQFGLVPMWAPDKKKYGLRTYNARSETVEEKPTYRSAWKGRRFGLILMDSFYEPNWESGKAIRYRIKRSDEQPEAAACIWERIIDKDTGEIILSFSMLTINATEHPVMKHFHKPEDEKRSIVILQNNDYQKWLNADQGIARDLLQLAPDNYLHSEASPQLKS